MEKYDVVVIGAGPGGYVAAIRCAQLGLSTACVESWLNVRGRPALGGTCLNVGCIPSKALLDSSHLYMELRRHGAEHGIQAQDVTVDLGRMMERKNKVVDDLTRGVAGLFRKHGVQWLRGHGRLLPERRVEVTLLGEQAGEQIQVQAEHVIIATGSVPGALPEAPVNNDLQVVDSTGALAFDTVPETLAIIGAGVIGLELGSVWNRLGSKVVLLEALPRLLPMLDDAVSGALSKLFKNQGLEVLLGAWVSATRTKKRRVTVNYEQQGESKSLEVDRLIVAVGRRANTAGLGLQECGVNLDAHGYIKVDRHCRSSLPGVYALGDVIGGPMLAHKASKEGTMVAELIAGKRHSPVNYDRVPWVIYTWPEIAWAGLTEEQAEERGHRCRSGRFPFRASGRARAMGSWDGFVKVVGEVETDRLLGVQAVGPNVSELIAEVVLALEFEASTEDLARTIHAHPTLSEALHEAALAVSGRALHA